MDGRGAVVLVTAARTASVVLWRPPWDGDDGDVLLTAGGAPPLTVVTVVTPVSVVRCGDAVVSW